MAKVRVGSTFLVEGVTRQQVWDYLEKIEHASEWNTFVDSAESPDPPGVGRQIFLHVGFLGLTFPVEAQAIASEEPERSVIEGRKPFRSEMGMELEDAPGGVEMTGWFQMDPGKFFPVPKFVLKKAVQRQYDRDTELLKRKLEALA